MRASSRNDTVAGRDEALATSEVNLGRSALAEVDGAVVQPRALAQSDDAVVGGHLAVAVSGLLGLGDGVGRHQVRTRRALDRELEPVEVDVVTGVAGL
ncbi:MAG: hypothetical protein V9E98_15870 [Candidatus Nanopelagicales bacterium]